MDKLKTGDIVARKSYGFDVLFKHKAMIDKIVGKRLSKKST